MITPAEIKQKALRLWTNQQYLRAWLQGQTLHPITIPFSQPRGKQLRERFSETQQWLATLRAHSKEQNHLGYTLHYETRQHRQLGSQTLPCKISIDTADDYLALTGKRADFDEFVSLVKDTQAQWPELWSELKPLLILKPRLLLQNTHHWRKLLDACTWFRQHPQPQLYLRQLDIPGIDSKFIETHRGVLTELLSTVLPGNAFDATITGLKQHGFERRFGLRFEAPPIRFRILDQTLALSGLTDLCIPLAEFAQLLTQFKAPVDTVFITENKTNGLCFPAYDQALVIFGLGYGIDALAEVAWLKHKRLIYWGDIDSHGFAILSRLRQYFPQTQSLLMDRKTLEHHRDLCVEEKPEQRFTGKLASLTAEEQSLYQALIMHSHAEPGNESNEKSENIQNLRLEQERIPYHYFLRHLQEIKQENTTVCIPTQRDCENILKCQKKD
jgi:hypothetical protein